MLSQQIFTTKDTSGNLKCPNSSQTTVLRIARPVSESGPNNSDTRSGRRLAVPLDS